ncbi:MAG: type IV toxin-antitoxin system AbiEi family antitoxin domain-containing protein, partial [Ornithinimicrobium sp.]
DPSFVRLSHPRDTGIFTAAEAVQAGFSVGEIQTLVRKGHLERIAIGTGCGRDIRAHSRRGRVRCRLTPRDV